MNLLQFSRTGADRRIGLVEGDSVIDLSQSSSGAFSSWPALLQAVEAEGTEITEFILQKSDRMSSSLTLASLLGGRQDRPPFLLPPVEAAEVWGCGVTYLRSRDAREDETLVKGIYDRVYESERPELFFKGNPRTVVAHNEAIGIREDSSWNVPEPELAFVLGVDGEIIGLTAGNDVSSRDIERQNPLYLPQAKIYDRSCSLGPTLLVGRRQQADLGISMAVIRDGAEVFQASTRTSRMKRSLDELRSHLLRCNSVPPLTVCLTGTGIVPPDDFTLQEEDRVEIELEKVGKLVNEVVKVRMRIPPRNPEERRNLEAYSG